MSSNFLKRILVTGGAGFIGSATIRQLLRSEDAQLLNFDKLTYVSSLASLEGWQDNQNYQFVEADICDRQALQQAFDTFQPTAIIHAAAETHVDRSIADPSEFVQTNLVGTFTLLEVTRDYWRELPAANRDKFRFLQVSTDEVYGSLGDTGLFTENSAYQPRSPYSASKAGSDHLVRAWHHTYGLPVLLTHCSNNYGPFQFPEKLIPRIILNALAQRPLPIYGTGENVRDWLFVDDHAAGLELVLTAGGVGQTYNLGGNNEWTNLQVVEAICQLLNERRPRTSGKYQDLITFVEDRPGHDYRYAIDTAKIRGELGWQTTENFESGLQKTVDWYLENQWWWEDDAV